MWGWVLILIFPMLNVALIFLCIKFYIHEIKLVNYYATKNCTFPCTKFEIMKNLTSWIMAVIDLGIKTYPINS